MIIRGDLALPGGVVMRDGWMSVSEGRITGISGTPMDGNVTLDASGLLEVPGFVDAHLHFPQTRIVGAASGPLLDWLATSTFPEEARFEQAAHAASDAGTEAGRFEPANETAINPHSPDEHMSCKWVRIDSDISIRSLCRWIEDNHGAPSG